MLEIPADAIRAAAEALNGHRHGFTFDCEICRAGTEGRARLALEAAAPFMSGVGSPASCPSVAPGSTQGPETPPVAPVYPPATTSPGESLSAPRGEDAHPHANEHAGEHADLAAIRERINRAHTELGEVCAQGPSRRFKMHIPADPERDTDLIISAALNDADLLTGEVDQLRETLARALRIADYHAGQHQQAADAIARVHQVCRQALATPDAPDRWAVAAQVRAALEGPEPQTGAGAVSEEQPAELSHWGRDPGHGGLTRHTGATEDCPGPDCGPSATEEQTGGRNG